MEAYEWGVIGGCELSVGIGAGAGAGTGVGVGVGCGILGIAGTCRVGAGAGVWSNGAGEHSR